ncbi:MAG: 16S rRNA (adenine(1518)-N(6)/adenine(1519)-N(6))-dimethyltransferase RsmA [Capsulimonadaceae bacterium]|nr:16S rRNA (adenine(1518)-N(6)/adenine(1519)-N(6))-dimethyltransferase RsmA [Capsulimonadaceae bacterium]
MIIPSNLASPAAVAQILRQRGISPRKRYGQNFLVDGNILARIVDSAELTEGAQVFEVGAGLGVLTRALAERVGDRGRVVSVEIDRDLIAVLADTLAGLPQARIVAGDVLATDLDALFTKEFDLAKPVSVTANIPYSITSPLIAALLERKLPIARIVLLVQREVALRLAAAPGTSDYGAFTVFCQYHTVVENLFTVPRTVFIPAPDVTSAVVRLTPRQSPPVDVPDEAELFAVIRAAFGQRRKTLPNALLGDPALGWTRERIAQALSVAGIAPIRRGETLSLAEFAAVARAGHERA